MTLHDVAWRLVPLGGGHAPRTVLASEVELALPKTCLAQARGQVLAVAPLHPFATPRAERVASSLDPLEELQGLVEPARGEEGVREVELGVADHLGLAEVA